MIKPVFNVRQREMAAWYIRQIAYDECPYAGVDSKVPYGKKQNRPQVSWSLIMCALYLLLFTHLNEVAMPGMQENLSAVPVHAQHSDNLAITFHVNGVVSVERCDLVTDC